MAGKNWPPLDVEMLKRLWAAGLTSGQIEARFDGRYSRNAIGGKIDRLGLSEDAAVKTARIKAGGSVGAGSNFAAGRATMAARRLAAPRATAPAVVATEVAESPWTEERDALLRKFEGDGLSHARIAAAINAATGSAFTRCAISGRLHRKGWASGRSQAQSTRLWAAEQRIAERGTAPFKQAPLPLPPEDSAALAGAKPLADLEHNECKWPLGDPRTPQFGFCGADAVPGLPYCAGHVARAYENPAVALRKAADREKKNASAGAQAGAGRQAAVAPDGRTAGATEGHRPVSEKASATARETEGV